jgi:hypothetical protein
MTDEMTTLPLLFLAASIGAAGPDEVDLEEWVVDWFHRDDCDEESYSVFARVLAKELLAEVRRGNL